MKPRRQLSLAGNNKLESVIPHRFGGWEAQPTDALVTPEEDGGLTARLYSQVVGRLYVNQSGDMIMLLIAYGDTQNDLLQLHRPEVCYPAFGFRIEDSAPVAIPLTNAVAIPGRALTASSPQRIEQILYWTRIGEHLPTDGRAQRIAKLSDQLAGVIPDGILVRVSTITDDPREGLILNRRFAADLMTAVPVKARPMLVGTPASAKLSTETMT